MKAWPGPLELAEYIKGKRKAIGVFRDGNKRCVLGYYADMCGLEYHWSVGCFVRSNVWGRGWPRLPANHWLFTYVGGETLQVQLSRLNDTTPGFGRVRKRLKQFAETGQ